MVDASSIGKSNPKAQPIDMIKNRYPRSAPLELIQATFLFARAELDVLNLDLSKRFGIV